MEHELRTKLIETAERLCAVSKLTEPGIGLAAIKDNTFFARIRGEGRDKPAGFTVKTYDRVMAFMEAELAKAQELAE